MNDQPTSKLRFVEREHRDWVDGHTYISRKSHVLQQWFREEPLGMHPEYVGEWRDVPLEEEHE